MLSCYFILIFMQIFMKTTKLLILLVCWACAVKAQVTPAATAQITAAATPTTLPTTEFYERFVLKTDPTPAPAGYGLTPEHPILVGAYEPDLTDQQAINFKLNRFYKTYMWADSSQVLFLSRKTMMFNNMNIEVFRVTKAGTKDTISLYTDLYKSGPIYVPKGFISFTREQLAQAFAPLLAQVKTYNAAPDKFGDDETKKMGFQILGYLQTSVGISYLMDNDYLDPILTDTSLDLDLRAYLVRCYMFHKFEYEVTGNEDAKKLAFNATVDDYKDVIAKHSFAMQGNLATTMVKK